MQDHGYNTGENGERPTHNEGAVQTEGPASARIKRKRGVTVTVTVGAVGVTDALQFG